MSLNRTGLVTPILAVSNPSRKVLGQSAPSATTETDLYTVPSGVTARGSVINIANRGTSAANFRVSVSVAGAATANKDYLVYDAVIAANDIIQLDMDITLGATDKVRVYASSANLSFSLFGEEYGPVIAQSTTGNYLICTSSTRPTATFAGLTIFETDTGFLLRRNAANSAWIQLTPESAVVATAQTTTSTSYADLATTGPAVTVETGTKALVMMYAKANDSGAFEHYMSVAVSGATTLAAQDSNGTMSGTSGTNMGTSRTKLLTGLTAGLNTFTLRYRVGGGTGTWQDREIVVVGVDE